MKTRIGLFMLPVMVLLASCGISGNNGNPDDSPKSDLEIRNLTVTPTDTSAVVNWGTTQQTVGTLLYGRSQTSLPGSVSSSLSGTHEVSLQPLESDTEYWIQITASSPLGPRVSSQPISFRTLVSFDLADSTAPVISDVQVNGITPNSATITWRTDDRARGSVFYGYNASYGHTLPEPDAVGYPRFHSVTLGDLAEGTGYHFRIQAVNRPGGSTFSDDLTFQTTERPYLEITPDSVRLAGNEDFQFAVTIRGAANVAGVAFMIGYDPQAVEILSVLGGGFWENNDGFLFLREYEDPARGRLQYDASWRIVFLNGTAVGTLANGGGEVALVNARAKGDGLSSPLRLIDTDENGDGKAETRLLDHNRLPMPFHIRNGWVIKQVK